MALGGRCGCCSAGTRSSTAIDLGALGTECERIDIALLVVINLTSVLVLPGFVYLLEANDPDKYSCKRINNCRLSL